MRAPAVVALTLVLLAAGCTSPAPPLVVGADHDGQEVTLQKGQRLQVRLASNPSTGYRWSVHDLNEALLATRGEPAYAPGPDCDDRPGCGGNETFTFEALASGRTPLELRYARSGDPAATESFRLAVRIT